MFSVLKKGTAACGRGTHWGAWVIKSVRGSPRERGFDSRLLSSFFFH